MPELPEVESIAEGLRGEIVGRRIEKFLVRQPLILRGPYSEKWRKITRQLQSCVIRKITRRGKRLIILTDGSVGMIVQLGMTGQVVLREPAEKLRKHTHFMVDLDDGRKVRFVDVQLRPAAVLWAADGRPWCIRGRQSH